MMNMYHILMVEVFASLQAFVKAFRTVCYKGQVLLYGNYTLINLTLI